MHGALLHHRILADRIRPPSARLGRDIAGLAPQSPCTRCRAHPFFNRIQVLPIALVAIFQTATPFATKLRILASPTDVRSQLAKQNMINCGVSSRKRNRDPRVSPPPTAASTVVASGDNRHGCMLTGSLHQQLETTLPADCNQRKQPRDVHANLSSFKDAWSLRLPSKTCMDCETQSGISSDIKLNKTKAG